MGFIYAVYPSELELLIRTLIAARLRDYFTEKETDEWIRDWRGFNTCSAWNSLSLYVSAAAK